MNKKLKLDVDGDGKSDLNLDLKTLILVIGGIISITMTYSTLTKQIEINKQQIEVAKKLPPIESHEILDQKIKYLEDHLEKIDISIDQLETKVYRR